MKVDSFNLDAATFAFLISTKAGGLGLNLTSANKCEILIASADMKQSSSEMRCFVIVLGCQCYLGREIMTSVILVAVGFRVVIIDPSYNPADDLQAMDRAFRIGQRRDVNVYRLVSPPASMVSTQKGSRAPRQRIV